MKKLAILTLATTVAATSYAAEKFTTTELKTMDCATLAVEKAEAKRTVENADKNIANINAQAQAPGKALGKWAGLAGNAISAFAGDSEKAGRANAIAQNIAGPEDNSEAGNLTLQQQIKSNAQANIDNIGIYQGSKKCKI